MESEQLLKQVEWLDEERRKDRNSFLALEERVKSAEGNVYTLISQIKELSSEVTRLTGLVTRMDQFDEAILKHKMDTKQSLDMLDNIIKKREEEIIKLMRVEIRGLENGVAEMRKETGTIAELKRALQMRIDEEVRMVRTVDEAFEKVEMIRHNEEEISRQYRLLDDGLRQEGKRITDVQSELAALRKRSDEHRAHMEAQSTSVRRFETRLNEWEATENEKRKNQTAFLENQTYLQAERDRVWKEWQIRFDAVDKHAEEIETFIQSIDETYRMAKRSQQILDDLTQKLERRIAEMTEMQRLTEERFRQEWVNFKADDQKSWTNYALTQEEQSGEMKRQQERLTVQVTQLEDKTQELIDTVQLINEQSIKQLQAMLTIIHEWVSTFERSFS